MPDDPSDRAVDAYYRGLDAVEHGDREAAEAAFNEAIVSGCFDAGANLAALLFEGDEPNRALEVLRHAADAGSLVARLNLANVLAYELKLKAQARTQLEIAAQTGDPRALFEYGQFLWYSAELTEAGAVFNRAAGHDPHFHLLVGFVKDELDDRKGALEAFQLAQNSGAKGATAHVGWQLMRLGRLDDARLALATGCSDGDPVSVELLRRVEGYAGDIDREAVLSKQVKRVGATIDLDYRRQMPELDGEGLQESELADWIKNDDDGATPLAICALMFDSPRIASAEIRLRLAIAFGDDEARDDLNTFLSAIGRDP